MGLSEAGLQVSDITFISSTSESLKKTNFKFKTVSVLSLVGTLLSVDWLVDCRRGRRPLPDADTDSAQQQEDHGSSQTDRHDGEDQR